MLTFYGVLLSSVSFLGYIFTCLEEIMEMKRMHDSENYYVFINSFRETKRIGWRKCTQLIIPKLGVCDKIHRITKNFLFILFKFFLQYSWFSQWFWYMAYIYIYNIYICIDSHIYTHIYSSLFYFIVLVAPMTCRSSWARDQTHAAAATWATAVTTPNLNPLCYQGTPICSFLDYFSL